MLSILEVNDCNGCVLLFYSQCGLITSTVLQNLSILVESASKSRCKKRHCKLMTLKSTWTAQSCVRPFFIVYHLCSKTSIRDIYESVIQSSDIVSNNVSCVK